MCYGRIDSCPWHIFLLLLFYIIQAENICNVDILCYICEIS